MILENAKINVEKSNNLVAKISHFFRVLLLRLCVDIFCNKATFVKGVSTNFCS